MRCLGRVVGRLPWLIIHHNRSNYVGSYLVQGFQDWCIFYTQEITCVWKVALGMNTLYVRFIWSLCLISEANGFEKPAQYVLTLSRPYEI